jgi:hypothetical protein
MAEKSKMSNVSYEKKTEHFKTSKYIYPRHEKII